MIHMHVWTWTEAIARRVRIISVGHHVSFVAPLAGSLQLSKRVSGTPGRKKSFVKQHFSLYVHPSNNDFYEVFHP